MQTRHFDILCMLLFEGIHNIDETTTPSLSHNLRVIAMNDIVSKQLVTYVEESLVQRDVWSPLHVVSSKEPTTSMEESGHRWHTRLQLSAMDGIVGN